mgnify:CR=1 FL=1
MSIKLKLMPTSTGSIILTTGSLSVNNQKGLAPIFIIIMIAIVGVGVYFFSNQKFNQSSPQEQSKEVSIVEVIVKENPDDKNKSDVYLKDKNGKETFLITLDEVYRNHIHSSEYHNGNLYIIQRTGGEEGYQNIPDWTDQLWKYDSNKQGKKLYSLRGLDFRVSDDEKLIAIIGYETDELEMLVLTDTNGNALAEFGGADLGVSVMEPLVWGKDTFWIVEKALPVPESFLKIDTQTFEYSKYIVLDETIGIEYVLNPETKKLAYSDYPPLFDADSVEEFKQSGKKVSLSVYDLVTDEKTVINTSITKKFNPKWIDENTLEYDDPKGEGRVKKKI